MNWEDTKFDVRQQLGGKECMFVGSVTAGFSHPKRGKLEFEVVVYVVFREGARIGQGLAWQDRIAAKWLTAKEIVIPMKPTKDPSRLRLGFMEAANS